MGSGATGPGVTGARSDRSQESQDPGDVGPGAAGHSYLGSIVMEVTELEGSGLSAWEFLEILQSSQEGLIPASLERKPHFFLSY